MLHYLQTINRNRALAIARNALMTECLFHLHNVSTAIQVVESAQEPRVINVLHAIVENISLQRIPASIRVQTGIMELPQIGNVIVQNKLIISNF